MSYQPPPPPASNPGGGPTITGRTRASGPPALNPNVPASRAEQPAARLYMLSGDQVGREYALVNRVTTLGRGANNDIVIADPKTSRQHIQIINENGTYLALDSDSANGFYVNDQQVRRSELHQGDIITIGLVRMAFQAAPGTLKSDTFTGSRPDASTTRVEAGQFIPLGNPPSNSYPTVSPPVAIDESALEHIDLRGRPLTSLGREQKDNSVVLDNPQVSRHHIQIVNQNTAYTINDLRSTNGTFVNGERITSAVLNDGDIVIIGPYRFMFTHGFLHRSQEDDSIRVDVLNLSKQVSPQVTLLHNITLTILPREFVAIVGVSGSGKTTLMDAISGVRPATAGTVLYNKAEYYSQMEVYRSTIGYVPQDDIVPTELTVYKALYYAARLRLPEDTSPTEIEERLEDVIDDLGLSARRNTPIRLLSGGQRKRVSIGAELISKPSLFFLDEPTSGLDPGLEGRMMQLLRKLADQGRTVVLITHATQNVELCDRVLFLARGGYVAFYGSPQEALTYFQVSKFSDIYIKLEQDLAPEQWASQFLASPFYAANVGSRLNAVLNEARHYGVPVPGDARPEVSPSGPVPPVTFRRPRASLSGFQQFRLLFRRYLEIITTDQRNLLILLLQAPIIALMMVLVFNRTEWKRPGGDYSSAKTLVFLMVIVSVWLGTSNAAREIVKEISIYRRERRIGLKLVPYIFSKLVVQTLLVLVQIGLLIGIVWAGAGLGDPSLETVFYLYLSLLLTALAGITLGLLISAMTSNSDRATSFVPVVLIPQIIFSGAVVALERMGLLGDWFSNLMISKWGYQTSGRILGLDSVPSSRVKFNGPPPEQAGRIESLFPGSVSFDPKTYDWYLIPKRDLEFKTDVYLQWGILSLMIVITVSLIVFFLVRKDRQV